MQISNIRTLRYHIALILCHWVNTIKGTCFWKKWRRVRDVVILVNHGKLENWRDKIEGLEWLLWVKVSFPFLWPSYFTGSSRMYSTWINIMVWVFSSPPICIRWWNSNWQGGYLGASVRSWWKTPSERKLCRYQKGWWELVGFSRVKTQVEGATYEAENRPSACAQPVGTLFLTLELWEVHWCCL